MGIFVAIIMVLASTLVNAGQSETSQRSRALAALVSDTMKTGYSDQLPPRLARSLGLTPPISTKGSSFGIEETADGLARFLSVALSTSSRGTPSLLVFQTNRESGRDSEGHHFVSDISGEPISVLVDHGKSNEKGEAIKGSAIGAPLDVQSRGVRKRFKHELEFWLEGKHWKKAALKKTCAEFSYAAPYCWGLKPKSVKSALPN